jgi:hypothetical protein
MFIDGARPIDVSLVHAVTRLFEYVGFGLLALAAILAVLHYLAYRRYS